MHLSSTEKKKKSKLEGIKASFSGYSHETCFFFFNRMHVFISR